MKQFGGSFGVKLVSALTIVVTRLNDLAGTAFEGFEDVVVAEINDDAFYGRSTGKLLSKSVEFLPAKFQSFVNGLDRDTDVLVLHVDDDMPVGEVARELKGLIDDRHQVLALEEV